VTEPSLSSNCAQTYSPSGRIFKFPVHESWEFTSSSPIRSAFALRPIYGLPMLILRWLSAGFSSEAFHPILMFRGLRIVMFLLSFILEDWAIHELVESRPQRRTALMLVASSYVTWTWQAHTFSNAIETIVVLWSVVFIRRLARFEVLISFPVSGICSLFRNRHIVLLPRLPLSLLFFSSLAHSIASPFLPLCWCPCCNLRYRGKTHDHLPPRVGALGG